MRRYLVVANQTLGSDVLHRTVLSRLGQVPGDVHLLAPATHADHYTAALAALTADGAAGGLPRSVAESWRRRDTVRLGAALERLRLDGIHATGAVGDPNPMLAIRRVLDRWSAHEVILATLPAGASRWLGLDLPTRVARRFGLPVVHVTAPLPQATAT